MKKLNICVYSGITEDNQLIIKKQISINFLDDRTSNSFYNLLVKYFKADKLKTEHAFTIALNDDFEPLAVLEIKSNKKHRVGINYKETLTFLTLTNAKHFISAHNHPTAYPTPSYQDIEIFHDLITLFPGMLMDTIIIGSKNSGDYFSAYEEEYFDHVDNMFAWAYINMMGQMEDRHTRLMNKVSELEEQVVSLTDEISKIKQNFGCQQ